MTPSATHYTPQQAAAALQVTVRTIYHMIRDGKLMAKRIGPSGRIYRIPKREING